MNELEDQLRSAFEARLGCVSPDREARLRAIDYRSRTSRHRRAWTAVGAMCTALVGGITAAVLLLSSSASPAYAGWSPIPTTPTAGAVAAVTAACNSEHSRTGPAVLVGAPVLTDARDRYTAAMYVNGQATYICIANARHAGGSALAMNRDYQKPSNPNQIGSAVGFGGGAPGFPGSGSGSAGRGYERNASGLAGPNVTAVSFTFSDGSTVDATVQNGRYFAWWPDKNWPTSVVVTTSAGTTTSPVP